MKKRRRFFLDFLIRFFSLFVQKELDLRLPGGASGGHFESRFGSSEFLEGLGSPGGCWETNLSTTVGRYAFWPLRVSATVGPYAFWPFQMSTTVVPYAFWVWPMSATMEPYAFRLCRISATMEPYAF